MKRSVFAVAACAGLCVPAMAGTVSGTGSVSLYGRSYGVTTWNINADATGNATPTMYQPSGRDSTAIPLVPK